MNTYGNYFTCVGSKAPLRSNRVFSEEDAKFESLTEFYNGLTKPIEAHQVRVERMFYEWLDLLFNENNIVVHGPMSKFELLETFKETCLDSDKIPDLKCQSSSNGSSTLNITTVRMHGAEPISLQTFLNAVFGYAEDKPIDEKHELKQFVAKLNRTRTHCVFLMHSFELLYQHCRKICDLIISLSELEPKFIHLILSSDHIYSPKIIHKLKFQLKLVFYNVPYTESYLYENAKKTGILEQMSADDKDAVGGSAKAVYSRGRLDLQSLQDVYQALQSTCKDILVYIIEQHLYKKKYCTERPGRKSGRMSSIKAAQRITTLFSEKAETEGFSTELKFSKLFEYCESKFICRRAAALRNHLGELIDHRLIELDESGKSIQCLIGEETCKTFLEELKAKAGTETE